MEGKSRCRKEGRKMIEKYIGERYCQIDLFFVVLQLVKNCLKEGARVKEKRQNLIDNKSHTNRQSLDGTEQRRSKREY
ncbi:MAG: hypothetical protein ACI3Z5_02715 [Paludibacteraceae bacterium]